MQQALDALRELSADPEIQRLAAVRERVLREQYWELAGEREEGRAAGYAQGEAQGITQDQAALLEHLLRYRFGPVSAATRTRLQTATPDQLDAWAERLLDAPNSDAVFHEP